MRWGCWSSAAERAERVDGARASEAMEERGLLNESSMEDGTKTISAQYRFCKLSRVSLTPDGSLKRFIVME